MSKLQYNPCIIYCIFVIVTLIIVTNTISFYTENTSLRIENPERNRRFPKGILGRAYESKNTRSDHPFKDL